MSPSPKTQLISIQGEGDAKENMKLFAMLVMIIVGGTVNTIMNLGFHVQNPSIYYAFGVFIGMIVGFIIEWRE